jgi:hypothetical protein
MKPYKISFLIVFLVLQTSCAAQQEKINGLSYVASRILIDEQHVEPVVSMNANYVAIMPYGFIRDLSHPDIRYNTERQWVGEKLEGVKHYIEEFHKKNIQIMLKPQIWIWKGKYTGHIEMEEEGHWKTLEDSYSKFLLDYSLLAEELKVPILCIGTELEKFVAHRPQFWKDLIVQIKKKYSGKLTYAANWDEFKRTAFWNELDFIGIDAYFPLSEQKSPSVKDCIKGWKQHKSDIKSISKRYNKPILFTEFGYRSVDFSGKEPWKSDHTMTEVNLEAQLNATQALFEEFWDEPWFAGGFVWKWFCNHEAAGGIDNALFTPQNKPVESYIKTQYSSYE